MAGLADSAIARLDDLQLPADDDEVEATRTRRRRPATPRATACRR
jgi:hypothetical protein